MAGCATTSVAPVAVEAPAPQVQQAKAQQAAQAPVAKRYKLKVAVGRFTNETNYGRSLLADADLDRIGKQASDMLASRLIQSGQFVVFERPDLSKVMNEQDIAGDSRLVGSDTLLIGSVTEFGRSVGGKVGFLSSTKVQTAKAKVDIRLVDVKTGHAYFSAIGAGEANTESGEVAGFGSRAAYDATLNDRAIAAAISDVIDKLVSKLGDRKWKTDILEARDGRVYISGGKHQGLKEGDRLAVMEAGATVKSRQTGFDIALPPKPVATLRVTGFFGETETDEGSVCEVVEGSLVKPLSPRLFVTESK
jgi:curli biogenesis system outer membrane secretion channel CsgG